MSNKKEWVNKPPAKNPLALKLARAIFSAGDNVTKSAEGMFVRATCQRIQFMLGAWPNYEKPAGGLCEEALVRLIETTLENHFNNMQRNGEENF